MSSTRKRHLHSLDSYRLLVPKLLWEAVPECSAANSVGGSGQVPSVALYLCLCFGPWYKCITFFVGQSLQQMAGTEGQGCSYSSTVPYR